MLAISHGDRQAVIQALITDPGAVAGMDHPPYKFAIRAVDQNAGREGQDEATRRHKDDILIGLIDALHPHANAGQNSVRELRLATEMAAGRGYVRAAMRLLDLGASLTNNVGTEILRDIWHAPDTALDPQRAARWQSSTTFERQTWEHGVLCTMALAGARPDTMEAFKHGMRSPLSPKLLSQALWKAMARVQARAMIHGNQQCPGATPASTRWLSKHLGQGGLEKTLNAMPTQVDQISETLDYLRAQLQTAQLDETSPRAQPRRHGARL